MSNGQKIFYGLSFFAAVFCSYSADAACMISSVIAKPYKDDYVKLGQNDRALKIAVHWAMLKNDQFCYDLDTWYAIADAYRHILDDAAQDLAMTIYAVLVSSQFVSVQVKSDSFRCLSQCNKRSNDLNKVFSYAKAAEAFGAKTATFGKTLRYLGDLYLFYLHDNVKAINYYKSSLIWCRENKIKKWEIEALIGLGNARYTDSKHLVYAQWYLEALKGLGVDGDEHLRAQALIGLGNAEYTDDKHSDYASWYLEALDVAGADGDLDLSPQALMSLGNFCRKKKW